MKKLPLLILIIIAISLLWFFDAGRYLDLAFIKENQEAFTQYYAEHPVLTIALFFTVP